MLIYNLVRCLNLIYTMSKIFNPQNKILCHLNKIEKYFANKNPAPITIEMDLSNACNHSCPFCISGHLHLKEYKKINCLIA